MLFGFAFPCVGPVAVTRPLDACWLSYSTKAALSVVQKVRGKRPELKRNPGSEASQTLGNF